jgi:hypothetical protein
MVTSNDVDTQVSDAREARERPTVTTDGLRYPSPPEEFRLRSPLLAFHVDVRLRERGGRWLAVADVRGEQRIGVGGNARAALEASVSTFGQETAAALLADPQLFGVSVRLLGRHADGSDGHRRRWG